MPPEPPHRFFNHPYLAASSIVIIVLFIFLAVALERSAGTSGGGVGTWGGAGGAFSSGTGLPTLFNALTGQPAQRAVTDLGVIPLPNYTEEGSTEGADYLAELLSLLTTPPEGQSSNVDTSAFSFIPQGLISVASPTKPKTAEQTALYNYGNEVGVHIQSFESMHTGSVQTLKDHAEDRADSAKQKQVERLAGDFIQFSQDLKAVEAPATMGNAHASFASAYASLGTNLLSVAQSTDDQAFLDAINKYNESVENLSRRFFALTSLFGAHQVTFSSSEPGSVFMFSAAPAL